MGPREALQDDSRDGASASLAIDLRASVWLCVASVLHTWCGSWCITVRRVFRKAGGLVVLRSGVSTRVVDDPESFVWSISMASYHVTCGFGSCIS